ncbi:MAG: MBL fold metallo-hydrolase [Bacteroidia bacterium]
MLFIRGEKFGRIPDGDRMERIKKSANYRDGKFQNAEHTPDLTEGVSMGKVMRDFFFSRNPDKQPPQRVPTKKTNLFTLNPSENVMVWFGHSSYFLQVDGRKILVDPVLSGAASPVKFTTRSFAGTDVYAVSDFPEIDVLFLTHDHWDHLDHSTIVQLRPKVKAIVTSLGVGAHLERWGISKDIIFEMDWNDELKLNNGLTVNSATARHFSGRGFKRAQAIWSSFVLTTPSKRIFIGGDSGYGKHFKTIGDAFGPFDLALLECGQYNVNWKYIHMMPEETAKAADDLNAKLFVPVHWGKFALAMHDWNEPIRRVTVAARQHSARMLSPLIGESLDLDHPSDPESWWEELS